MGLGIIGTALAGAAEGAGTVAADMYSKSALMDEAAAIQKLRDDRMNEFAAGESTKAQTHQEGLVTRQIEAGAEQGRLTRDHLSKESGLTRSHASSEAGLTRMYSAAESQLGRSLQRELAELHERSADTRHKETTSIQRAGIGLQMAQLEEAKKQVQLVPQDDGRILKMKKDGESAGYVMVDGKEFKGKGISDVTKILMSGNERIIGVLETAMAATKGKEMMTAEEKSAELSQLQARITHYTNENKKLAGIKVDEPAAPAAAIPMPASAAELKKDTVYLTGRGPATWNGTAFVKK